MFLLKLMNPASICLVHVPINVLDGWDGMHWMDGMETMWKPHENHVGPMWKPHENHVGTCANHVQTMCKPFGNHMKTMWGTCGNHMKTMWETCANHVQTTWKPCGGHVQTMCKPCANHVETTWKPCGEAVSCWSQIPNPKTKPGLPGEIWQACQHMVIKECRLQGEQYLLLKYIIHLQDLHVLLKLM